MALAYLLESLRGQAGTDGPRVAARHWENGGVMEGGREGEGRERRGEGRKNGDHRQGPPSLLLPTQDHTYHYPPPPHPLS